jgi:hypothetical protein
MTDESRRPVWSQPLTRSLGRRIPGHRRPAALAAIRAVHTVIFASVAAAIALFVWDGVRQAPRRRAALALGIAVAETGIYLSNNQVCPLTPLAEDLGAESGAVVDLFLPAWAARNIPLVGSAALLVGLTLHARAMLSRR